MTDNQLRALKWLARRNGTGVFCRDGVLLAAGDRAPIMRSTWNTLRDAGYLTIDKRRVTLTDAGNQEADI